MQLLQLFFSQFLNESLCAVVLHVLLGDGRIYYFWVITAISYVNAPTQLLLEN